jgi:RNA polymerase sigma-70 factor (ECF subfamily)
MMNESKLLLSLIHHSSFHISPSMAEAAPQADSDTELLHAVARGDESALAALYDRYNSILLGLLLRILHSRTEAEDVLQEVFIQIWQRAANFDEARGRGFTWMVTLARSRAIDRLRALQSRQRADDTAMQNAPEQLGDASDDAYYAEQREIVRAALAEIPEEQRRALLLAYFEGLTQSEIAARLGQPLGTVKTRMRSGMTKLRELLSGKMGHGANLNF